MKAHTYFNYFRKSCYYSKSTKKYWKNVSLLTCKLKHSLFLLFFIDHIHEKFIITLVLKSSEDYKIQ